jgi:hypothetical protein
MNRTTTIECVTLEVDDLRAAERFYATAFGSYATALGVGPRVRLRASDAPTSGFRAFTLSLVVSQPATVDSFVRAALDAGATSLKPPVKQFWGGYSGRCASPRRDDLESRELVEEEHRSGYEKRRRDRSAPGSRRFCRKQALLRRPRLGGRKEHRPHIRRVRRPVKAHQAGSLQAPRFGQGRRGLPGRLRIASARDRQRCGALHRPGRVRVGGAHRRNRERHRSRTCIGGCASPTVTSSGLQDQ